MNPAFLDSMSWEMAEVFGAISDQILINLSRYFPHFKDGNLPGSSFAYQATMLAQMGKITNETVKIIRQGLSGADDALERFIKQAIIDSIKQTQPELLDAVKKGLMTPPGAVQIALTPNQTRAFSLYYQQSADKLNMVNSVMLESTRQAYQQTVSDIVTRINNTQRALNIGAGETITGVASWNQAVRDAIKILQGKGITGFIDHAGRRWSAEAYVAMDIRTTLANTARAATWETNQNFGNDLYQVSYHIAARPLCYPWQCKVISATDNARTTHDLYGNEVKVYAQSETTYGQPAGLFGINCGHYPMPFIPGVSTVRTFSETPEEAKEGYKLRQNQRALERKIREQKRDLMMLKERGVPQEEIDAQQAKIKDTSAEINEFCKAHGLPRERERESVYTKRSFPSADTYDVTQFENAQKEAIEDYYRQGGEQKGFNFGTLVPLIPFVQGFKKEQKKQTPTPTQQTPEPETPEVARPANEQEVLKQFKRYDPATKTDKEKLEQVNPKYYTSGSLAWRNNCQRTVVTQEMIYRGYDVTAKPYDRNDAIGSSGIAVWDIRRDFWKDPEVSVSPTRSSLVKTITDALQSWGDGSRGIIRVQWTKQYGGNGHFLFARNVGGEIEITDPQNGKVVDIKEKLKFITTKRNQTWVMRVDNRRVNDNITLAMQNEKE